MEYQNPIAYVSDIEVMLNVSYRTARRVMQKIRAYYGISGKKHLTMVQVKEYLKK